jgi:cysteine-rich repeat protein
MLPAVKSSDQTFIVDTAPLADNFSDLTACTGHLEPGNDGFFAVTMLNQERWHVHVHPHTAGVDTAIYIVPSCDDRSCAIGDGEDECGVGRDEHMSFVAPTAGSYIVGIDSRTSGGGTFEVLAEHPVCGDGVREHSEACDDGNIVPGDGCDELCRAEMWNATADEVEPNDDWLGANVLELSAQLPAITMHANLGGKCDFDTYAIKLAPGASFQATVLDATGAPCATAIPAIRMTVLMPDGHYPAAPEVDSHTIAGCPVVQSFTNTQTTTGTFFVRVTTSEDVPVTFGYTLNVQLH